MPASYGADTDATRVGITARHAQTYVPEFDPSGAASSSLALHVGVSLSTAASEEHHA
jgi:hypothetical protein